MTEIEIVHVPYPAIVPFAKASDVEPEVGVGVNAPPPQPEYEIAGVAATVTPLGSASTKLTPLTDEAVGLVMLNERVETSSGAIALGANDFEKPTDPGDATSRYRAADPKSAL